MLCCDGGMDRCYDQQGFFVELFMHRSSVRMHISESLRLRGRNGTDRPRNGVRGERSTLVCRSGRWSTPSQGRLYTRSKIYDNPKKLYGYNYFAIS